MMHSEGSGDMQYAKIAQGTIVEARQLQHSAERREKQLTCPECDQPVIFAILINITKDPPTNTEENYS